MIVLAPHTLMQDSFFFVHHGLITGLSPSVVSHYGLRKTFLIGPLTAACGAIYLDRENRDSRSAAVHEINRRVKTKQPLPQLVMFPEGAVTNGRSLLQFKAGAFIPRGTRHKLYSMYCLFFTASLVPVQPVAVSFEGWRTGTCSKGTNQAWLLLVTFANLRMKVPKNPSSLMTMIILS